MPPRYLQDYHTELYGRPPIPLAEAAQPAPDTFLLRQEVAELKGIVKDLIGKMAQYDHSYSEGDSQEECNAVMQPQEAQQ